MKSKLILFFPFCWQLQISFSFSAFLKKNFFLRKCYCPTFSSSLYSFVCRLTHTLDRTKEKGWLLTKIKTDTGLPIKIKMQIHGYPKRIRQIHGYPQGLRCSYRVTHKDKVADTWLPTKNKTETWLPTKNKTNPKE